MPTFGEDPFDESIREAFEEHVKQSPTPLLSATEAWKKMQKAKVKPRKNDRKLFIAAVAILFAVIIIQLPKNGNAFSRFTDMYYTVQGSVIQLFGVSGSENKSAQKSGTEPEESIYI